MSEDPKDPTQTVRTVKTHTTRIPLPLWNLLVNRARETSTSANLCIVMALRDWLGLPRSKDMGVLPPKLSAVLIEHMTAMEERLTALLDPQGLRHVTSLTIDVQNTGADSPELSEQVAEVIRRSGFSAGGRLGTGNGSVPRPGYSKLECRAAAALHPLQVAAFQRQKDAFEPGELSATGRRILHRPQLQPLPPVVPAEGHPLTLPTKETHLPVALASLKDNHVQAMIALAETADRLQGTEWVLHGTLPLNHDQIGDCLKALGAKVPGCVTKRTRVLVAGPNALDEVLNRAEQHCVEIWDGEMIMQFIRAADPTLETQP